MLPIVSPCRSPAGTASSASSARAGWPRCTSRTTYVSDRQVALKVVKSEVAATVGADRFISEIRTTAHLKHPHILPLFDSGAVGDIPFYVMPYIEGESLRARLRGEKRLPVADTLLILRELADALAYAHAHGIVHRDIEPDNVLLSGRHVFLADFGIARALEDRRRAAMNTDTILI